MFARVGATIMFWNILISSLGTQQIFSALPRPTQEFSLQDIGFEIKQAFQATDNRNFQSLFLSGISTGCATGLGNALNLYLMNYFFDFTGPQIAAGAAAILVSPLMANYIAPMLGQHWGKKTCAIYASFASFALSPLLMVMVLNGFWPPLGSWTSLYVHTFHQIIMVLLSIISGVMTDSMMSDVVEDSEVSTDRRSEGLFFAARGFAGKIISGCGVMFAGSIISMVGLDEVKSAADMTWQKRFELARFYVPLHSVLQLVSLCFLSRYGITRVEHEANLMTLAQRRDKELPLDSIVEEAESLLKRTANAQHPRSVLENCARRRPNLDPPRDLFGAAFSQELIDVADMH